MAVYEEYLNYRLTGRCSNPFWQRKFGGVSDGGGDAGGDGGEPAELLSWEGVAYHIDKGDYKDVYKIGDLVPLDLGSEGLIHMQVAAIDADDLADGSGKAPMTFIAKELLATPKRMNPALSGTTEGTGTIGGWDKCELRSYLQNTIMPLIPVDVASMICEVIKTQIAYNVSGTSVTQTTNDRAWIPDAHEINSVWVDPGEGWLTYNEMYTDNASRVKNVVGTTTGNYYWTRAASSNKLFRIVKADGSGDTYRSDYNRYICLGFCTGVTPT